MDHRFVDGNSDFASDERSTTYSNGIGSRDGGGSVLSGTGSVNLDGLEFAFTSKKPRGSVRSYRSQNGHGSEPSSPTEKLQPIAELPPLEDRDAWGNKMEFLLASIGLAVGLGNIWRFPYLCQKNGGGAFLIPYFIFMIIEGLPLFFIEFAIGQRMRTSAIGAWSRIHPALYGVGVSCVVASFMVCVYYIIVLTWCTYYFFMSFSSTLPWRIESCDGYEQYKPLLANYTYWSARANGSSVAGSMSAMYKQRMTNMTNYCCYVDPPLHYFYNEALDVSPSISGSGNGVNWKLVGCLLLAWVVVYFCVVKGVKSSGKVVYFTATFPYIILVILFFRGVTLEGANIGIKAFFKPKFELLTNARIWMDAATQIFYTLSLGYGALIAFSSYMPMKNNCMRDAYIVVLINCGTSIFAGIVVFSILGYRELKTGIPADKVGSGPGMAFMTFTDAFLLMEVSPLWSALFFFMLILLGIDSEFGTLEAAIAPLFDEKIVKMKKAYFTAIAALVMFLFGISLVSSPGFYLFQIFDDYSVTLPVLLIALFQVVGISWVYGNDRFANDIEYMTGSRPNVFWLICWKYISPIALLIVFITSSIQTASDKPSYQVYVGCEEQPFSSLLPGSKQATDRIVYPGWGQFLVFVVIMVSILPMIFYLVKNWPKGWRMAFRRTFLSGIIEYLPDPSTRDPTRRISPAEMDLIVRKEMMSQNSDVFH